MQTVIVALNSKFIHASLAPWYLKAACGNECGEIAVVESTINDQPDNILAAIYRYKPDIIAFSCYIWNISLVLRLAENLKKILKNSIIILGGPEVSFESAEFLNDHPFVDFILQGEGELSFSGLLRQIAYGESKYDILEGVSWRSPDSGVKQGKYALVSNLDSLPSPYTDEMLGKLKNRIAYYESSRGCPYSCSYCISSTFKGTRYFSLDRVYSDLDKLVGADAKQVKFVDRTFNCNPERAGKIFSYIIEKWGTLKRPVNFHFEAAADLFDQQMVKRLATAPEGLFQFEIGIQSTNVETLEAVNRKSDLELVFKNVKALLRKGNIHIHVDLIAGLPFEGLASFKKSFNEVYSLFPHQLQLGFLKLLKGSDMRKKACKHGYSYKSYPPYEILENKYINYNEITELKLIEELVERYYNSGKYRNTLRYIMDNSDCTSYEFYRKLMLYCLEKDCLNRPLSVREQYNTLLGFFRENGRYDSDKLNELLKLDFLLTDNSGNLPDGISKIWKDGFKQSCFDFLKDPENIRRCLPAYSSKPAKEIFKQVHFELFNLTGTLSVYLFDYGRKSRVTGIFGYLDITDSIEFKG